MLTGTVVEPNPKLKIKKVTAICVIVAGNAIWLIVAMYFGSDKVLYGVVALFAYGFVGALFLYMWILERRKRITQR